MIRVVLFQAQDQAYVFFSTDPIWTVQQILEAAAHRGSIEQLFRDLKQVCKLHGLAAK
ncbi:MAG: hypothetical protein NZ602_14650 [Thermoguttaceae bacterium]|nr:hypothetical protein [Thermoguttaceae bacterium]MDW8036538.1 hypothetical protein [Thermoguttaceae bacterium]